MRHVGIVRTVVPHRTAMLHACARARHEQLLIPIGENIQRVGNRRSRFGANGTQVQAHRGESPGRPQNAAGCGANDQQGPQAQQKCIIGLGFGK